MKLTAEQIAALHIMETVKFFATVDATGLVNVAPILSTDYYQDDTLIFGDFLMWKTKQNLLQNSELAVLVMDQGLNYFTIRGTFLGFAQKGPAFEFMNESPLFKYNAYTGVRSAGLIRIDSVSSVQKLNKLAMAAGYLGNCLKPTDKSLNRVVMEKFTRLQALKALAWKDANGIEIIPVTNIRVNGPTMTLSPVAGPSRCQAALSVITMDPVTYQVKGTLENTKGISRLQVEEIYAGGLPTPGKRIL